MGRCNRPRRRSTRSTARRHRISLAFSVSSLETVSDRYHSIWSVFTDYPRALLFLVVTARTAACGVRESRAISSECVMTFQWTAFGPSSPRRLPVRPMTLTRQCAGCSRISSEKRLLFARLRTMELLSSGRGLPMLRSCWRTRRGRAVLIPCTTVVHPWHEAVKARSLHPGADLALGLC